ncbi:MAG: NADH-quinone oxidoreductase subunit H [Candidatus Saganbacteria bacterium]|nr:NADH-quinone oxidoreductase subunit H [Candidatus Saganbacteria bacterium]
MPYALFTILVFPGFLFLSAVSLFAEFFDRRIYARLQNRKGPPWFQPLADFIKLAAKEDIVPREADLAMFNLAPIFALTAVVTAFFYIPLWGTRALCSFQGDLIVVLYLLTIPTLTFFLGGWYSRSLFSALGAVRSITQLFAYEIPLFISLLAPALLADTWSLSGIAAYYQAHPFYWLFNLVGFGVALVALLGKLERVPFDIPEAETEIVAGSFTEYGGKMLAYFRLAIDSEAVVGASLLAAVYLPFGLGLNPLLGFVLYLIKVFFIIGLIALLRTVFARLRIDQMIVFCWQYVAPIAFLQILFNLVLKGFVLG